MKVLLTSDLHMNLRQLEWLETQAEQNDLIIIAGDTLQIAYTENKKEQISQVVPILERIRARCPLIIASGNHDANLTTPSGEDYAAWLQNLRSLSFLGDGGTLELEGYHFTCCPWWNGPEIRHKMLAQIKAAQPPDSRRWIWIHHAPPRGSRIAWTSKGEAGDPYLLKLIGQFQPAMVLCGHIHNAPFYPEGSWAERIHQTWVFNAGKQPGDIPTHIEFDLALQTARHTSLEDQETIELST